MAVFVPSDVTCVHVMHAALGLGLRVPEQVAILGVNNEELICDYAPVSLSSIDINFEEHGYRGAALLNDVFRGRVGQTQRPATRPSGIVERQSTNILAVPDVHVASALRFIWANLDRVLAVGEVAGHVSLSQSALTLLFRKHLQTTVIEEIARSRIEKAKTLLSSGEMMVKEVAQAAGFTSANYFNNVFRGATGMTPRAFRLANTRKATEPAGKSGTTRPIKS